MNKFQLTYQIDNPLWSEAYRPRTVQECILSDQNKAIFQGFVDSGLVPNLLLAGGPGIGKTSVAIAMLEELGADYLFINSSLNGGIDTLRNEIQNFASSVSFTGKRKYVILDEADNLSNSLQLALRGFIEEFSDNCGFILTCNFISRILPAIAQSRCSVIDFNIQKQDKTKLALAFARRVMVILENENVKYDKTAIAEFIRKYFPDCRRIINELQKYSVCGNIDAGILVSLSDKSFKELIGYLKDKNFSAMRKWVVENSDMDTSTIFRKLYDHTSEYVEKESIPQLVLHIAEYQYKASFVADQEINTVACLLEIMVDVLFK